MEEQNQNQTPNPDNGGTNGNGPDKPEKTVPYERFQAVNAAKRQAEETLAGLVTEMLDDIPEQFRSLVPDLPPAAKITWIRSAQKSGIFTAKPEPSGPDSKRPGSKPATDFNSMTATQRMASGYSK